MSKKSEKDDNLDTETTFADMNLEGFRWYDPSKKKDNGEKTVKQKVSGKEYRRMVRSAYLAFLPYLAVFLLVMGGVVALIYLWLK